MKAPHFAAFLIGICLTAPPAAMAEAIKIADTDTIASVLAAHKGKRVTVQLKSGQELTGTVRSVGKKLLHLGELSGKEFFDAAIDTSDIAVVIVRVRTN